MLFNGGKDEILFCLRAVRFKNRKAEYLIKAREKFSKVISAIRKIKNIMDLRDWLVKNVRGFGYKEASHFLRNIGRGENLAVLDRHVLRSLKRYGVIDEIPASFSKKTYIEIERKLVEFAKRLGIPVSHIDLLFWAKETGKIFK